MTSFAACFPSLPTAVRRLAVAVLTAFLAVLWAADHANAVSSPWQRSEYGAVRMISGAASVPSDREVMAGIQLRLDAGWKIYWRSPGETGVPTSFDWSGSENVAEARVYWPTPIRFSDFEFETYGYEREVVFPVAVTPKDPTRPMILNTHMTYGVCKNICIPMDVTLEIEVPADVPLEDTRFVRVIDEFRNRVPRENGAEGLSIESISVQQGHLLNEAEVFIRSESRLQWPDVAIELPPGFRTGIPAVNISLDRRSARLKVPLWTGEDPPSLDGKTVMITVWDEDGRSIEREMVIERRSSAFGSAYD